MAVSSFLDRFWGFSCIGALVLSAIASNGLLAAEDDIFKCAGVHVLQNESVRIAVMDPVDAQRYYQGARFTNLAFVLQAEYAGHSYLYVRSAPDPLKHGAGLASEFDMRNELNPPGYDEAAIGEGFLKIGVGVVRKSTETYQFYNTHELIEPATTSVRWEPASCEFEQFSAGINGYAYRLKTKLSLVQKSIRIDYQLTNTGEKPFVTEHYNHNFLSFDGADVGPGYRVRIPEYGVSMNFDEPLPEPMNWIFPTPKRYAEPQQLFVEHTNGQQIQIATTGGRMFQTYIHAARSLICPEQFIRLELQPGESSDWTRSYDLMVGPGTQ